MKIALLIGFWFPATGKGGYVWQSPNEKDLSPEFGTREQALANRPKGYNHLDDGWNKI